MYNKESQKKNGADRRGAAIKKLAGPGWPDLMADILQWCLSFFRCGQFLKETYNFLKEMY